MNIPRDKEVAEMRKELLALHYGNTATKIAHRALDMLSALSLLAAEARNAALTEASNAARNVVPRHTECGLKIAAAIEDLRTT